VLHRRSHSSIVLYVSFLVYVCVCSGMLSKMHMFASSSLTVCITMARRYLPGLRMERTYLQHYINKKHFKNVGPIRYCEPPLHCQSLVVASRAPAVAIAQAACDVHDIDNDNA